MSDLDDIDRLHQTDVMTIGSWGSRKVLISCVCGWHFSAGYVTPAEFDAAIERARDEHEAARRA